MCKAKSAIKNYFSFSVKRVLVCHECKNKSIMFGKKILGKFLPIIKHLRYLCKKDLVRILLFSSAILVRFAVFGERKRTKRFIII